MKFVYYSANCSFPRSDGPASASEQQHITSTLTPEMLIGAAKENTLGSAPWTTLIPLDAYFQVANNMSPEMLKLFHFVPFSQSPIPAISEAHIVTPDTMITIQYLTIK